MSYYNWRGQLMPETATEQDRIVGTSAGNETVYAPAGHSSVSGEGGGDVLVGSSGDNRHWITDRNDRVVEQPGGGIDTTIGWTAIKLAPNVENLIVHGDFNYAAGNELPNLIQVDGKQWVYGGGGDDVLVGGFNPVTFIVRAGEGNDVIYNWNTGSQLQLWNYGLSTAAQIKAAMVQQGSDVVLKFNNGESLTFRDTTLASFQDKQFLLPVDRSQLGPLTFSDEFNSLQLYDYSTQTGLWRTNFGNNLKDIWAYSLPSNGEQQVYVDPSFQGSAEGSLDFNPFSVANGVLTIKAEHIPAEKQAYTYGRDFASGMINTLGGFEQKYGYFEMRAELPTAKGAWSAFWMFPTPFVAGMEADILESLGITPHVDYRRAYGSDINAYDNTYRVEAAGMHTYGMLWTPTTVTFYYDDVAVLSTPTPANWTLPMGLIVNFAVGGWGGQADPSQFPAEMKVDYVRVYGLADNSHVVERTDFQAPNGTIRATGEPTSGQTPVVITFEDTNQPVTSGKIFVSAGPPADVAPGKNFYVWEQGGAIYGAAADGEVLDEPQIIVAGSISQFDGSGTWLSDGRIAVGYTAADGAGKAAWVVVFDPVTDTFLRQELGASASDPDFHFVALDNGSFAVSWEDPTGKTLARGFDSFGYDGKGWTGPTAELTGDLIGATASGQLIAASGSGQQLYNQLNQALNTDAVVSIGPGTTVTQAEGEDLTAFTFTITRDTYLWQKSTVAWSVTGFGPNSASAADFKDGLLPSGVVTFEINDTSKTVTVWVRGDALQEADEDFKVSLQNPANARIGTAEAFGRITTGDGGGSSPPPSSTVALSTTSLTKDEGDSGLTAFTYTVTRSGSTSGVATVDWAVAGSGADPAAAADFKDGVLPSGSLTFAAGEASKTITVNVVGDTAVEPGEGFTLTLSNASGATIGTASATGTIANDDSASPPPSGGQVINSPGAGSTLTGGDGADTLNASAGPDVLTGGAGNDVFAWAQKPWAPAHVTDFAIGSDRIDFSKLFQAAGYTGADPVADKIVSFLDDGSGGTKVLFDRDGAATGQQWPDYVLLLEKVPTAGLTWAKLQGSGGASEPPPPSSTLALSTTSLTLNEGASGLTAFAYTVTRTGSSSGVATVNWSVAGSGANPASAADFQDGTLPSGTLTFAAGETSKTITVNVMGDTAVEPGETFTLTLSNASGATLGAATASGEITNDDNASPPPAGGQVINSPGAGSTLNGGDGADTLNASAGPDVLTGGAGNDVFAWADEPWAPATITDFQVGQDRLDLSALFRTSGYTGSDPIKDGYVRLQADGTNTLVLFDRDGPGGSPQWPNYILKLERVGAADLTWARLAGDDTTQSTISFRYDAIFTGEGPFTFEVIRTGSAANAASVRWSVQGEAFVASGNSFAATDANDFEGGVLPSGVLDFAPGEASKIIRVPVAQDTTSEGNEAFNVLLSSPTGAVLGQSKAVGGIYDNDGPPPSGAGQVVNSAGPGSTLQGTAGNDTLNSSQGSDILIGGAGADHFVFAKENWSPAVIKDFERGVDKIDLRGMLDAVGYTGNDPIAAGYLKLSDDGAGGTNVLFDRDLAGSNPVWPNYIFKIEKIAPAQLSTGDWIFQ